MDTLYGLSFETRGARPVPTLIISIKREQGHKFMEILRNMTQREPGEKKERYLKESSLPFNLENGFGHGKCGTIETDNEKIRFVFRLARKTMRETTATISNLLFCLSIQLEDHYRVVDEDQQLFILSTSYLGSDHYSHAVTGYSSPRFKKWLDDYFESHPKVKAGRDIFAPVITRLPHSFIEALTLACRKLFDRALWSEGVGAHIREDQLFSFRCPGNAASAGTYPNEQGMISSHNVWAPEMQLTLLTGLFSLFEFIQKYPDAKSAP